MRRRSSLPPLVRPAECAGAADRDAPGVPPGRAPHGRAGQARRARQGQVQARRRARARVRRAAHRGDPELGGACALPLARAACVHVCTCADRLLFSASSSLFRRALSCLPLLRAAFPFLPAPCPQRTRSMNTRPRNHHGYTAQAIRIYDRSRCELLYQGAVREAAPRRPHGQALLQDRTPARRSSCCRVVMSPAFSHAYYSSRCS